MKKLFSLIILSLVFLFGCAFHSTSDEINPETLTSKTEASAVSSDTAAITSLTTLTNIVTIQTTTVSNKIMENTPEDGQLVRILDYIPDAVIDMRYATTNNFTGVVLYEDSEAYLCYGTVKKLMQVQEELKEKGYRILIWDAYRSPDAQWKLWEAYPDPTFVADPRNGITGHSQGNTIDISMIYEDGSSVEMPSAFDEFAAIADRDYSDVSKKAKENAMILESVMYKNGFTGYSGEWWDYSDTQRYNLINISDDSTDSGEDYISLILEENDYNFSHISKSGQLIIVESNNSNCKVSCYEKVDGFWKMNFDSSGILGMNGATDYKQEGDKKTPRGLYPLGFAFGTLDVDTKMEYRLINDMCYWIDDQNSEYYNQWVETSTPSWNSAEHLIEYAKSYKYAVVIEYNTNPVVKGRGSAIFLHCATGSYTAGCVAVPEKQMFNILSWLDEKQSPMILIV